MWLMDHGLMDSWTHDSWLMTHGTHGCDVQPRLCDTIAMYTNVIAHQLLLSLARAISTRCFALALFCVMVLQCAICWEPCLGPGVVVSSDDESWFMNQFSSFHWMIHWMKMKIYDIFRFIWLIWLIWHSYIIWLLWHMIFWMIHWMKTDWWLHWSLITTLSRSLITLIFTVNHESQVRPLTTHDWLAPWTLNICLPDKGASCCGKTSESALLPQIQSTEPMPLKF